jgi:hypothetical protein
MADDLKRVVVWKNLLINGTDYCGLWHTAEGWLVKGTVVGVLKDQRPMLANYEIHCDDNWLTTEMGLFSESSSTLGEGCSADASDLEFEFGAFCPCGRALLNVR